MMQMGAAGGGTGPARKVLTFPSKLKYPFFLAKRGWWFVEDSLKGVQSSSVALFIYS